MDTPTKPFSFTNLGGKPRVPQPEDEMLGAGATPTYTFPATKPKPANRSYYFQGQQPACGAHAGTAFLDSLQRQAGIATLPYNTPQDVWANINANGQDPNDGTTMDRIFAVLGKTGTVPFEPLGNNVTLSIPEYASMAPITAQITALQGQNVIDPKSVKYLSDLSLSGLKQAIHDYGAVIVLLQVCARLYENANGQADWDASVVCPLVTPSAQFPVIDGHFVVFDYYDENYVYGPNSFTNTYNGNINTPIGPVWGLQGDVQMGADYTPWVVEAGVAKLLHPVSTIVPTPATVAQVESVLPAATDLVNHFSTLTPEQKAVHQDWFTQAENILATLMQSITGHS